MKNDLKILIIDDMPTILKLLKRILKQLGFNNIFEASDGKSAWKILESQNIGLVIADWNMPQMDGLELLKKIRLSNIYKKIPFLMLTGNAEKENILKAAHAGVTDYAIKPFTAEIISDKITKII